MRVRRTGGVLLARKDKGRRPRCVVLFITAYADTEKAVRAIKAGATDFIPKPWEKEKLLATLSAALKLRESRTEINTLKQRVEALGSLMIPALRLSVRAMSCRICLPRLPN